MVLIDAQNKATALLHQIEGICKNPHIRGSRRLESQHECILHTNGVSRLVTSYWLPDKELKAAIRSGLPMANTMSSDMVKDMVKGRFKGRFNGQSDQNSDKIASEIIGISSKIIGILSEFHRKTIGIPMVFLEIGIYVYTFPFPSVHPLVGAELQAAVKEVSTRREEFLHHGKLSQTQVGAFLFGKVKNDTKRIALQVIEQIEGQR